MGRKQIQLELWLSQDMGYLRRLLLIDVIGYAVMAGFMLLIDEGTDRSNLFTMLQIIAVFAVLPMLMFCLWRTVKIFRKPESYIFRNVRFDQPKGGSFRDTICFRVSIELSSGKTIYTKTHSIFQTRGIGLLMEDYVNAIVCVAYNEETEMLIVIG